MSDQSHSDSRKTKSEYSFDVQKNAEGIGISVYNGLTLTEETWRTWAELGVEKTDTFTGRSTLFEFSSPASDSKSPDAATSTIEELRETAAELNEIVSNIEDNGATEYDEKRLRSIGNELERHVDEGVLDKS